MKIVHICLTGGYTEGINYQENYLTKYHALEGHEVTVITTQYCWYKNIWGKCDQSEYYNDHGVYVIRIPYKWDIPYKVNTYIGRFACLYDQLQKIRPDIIFIHNLQFQDIRLIKKYKKKYPDVQIFADNHSDLSNSARNWVARNLLYRFWWRPCVKSVEKSIDRFYGVLPARVAFLKDVYDIAPDKIELLVMGADDEAVKRVSDSNIRENVRMMYGIAPSDFLIVTGGKIDTFKLQTLMLMEAVKNIDRQDVKLLVFGSVEDDIKPKLNTLCDGNKIQYIGWAQGDRSYDYFSAADLVVFPGRHSVYWEQVAGIGIPMICKYWEGTTHIDLGGNVKFLRDDSVDEMRTTIERLLNNPEEYRTMLQNAQGEEKQCFSYQEIAKRSIEI